MTSLVQNRKLIEILSVSDVASYLQKHGWQQVSNPNPNALVFSGFKDLSGKPQLLVVPATVTLIDAERRLNDVVRSLALLEAKSPQQIVQSIRRAGISRSPAQISVNTD